MRAPHQPILLSDLPLFPVSELMEGRKDGTDTQGKLENSSGEQGHYFRPNLRDLR